MSEVTRRRLKFSPPREMYDLDFWIRESLRTGAGPAQTLRELTALVEQNAVEMGFIEHADGSWRFAGEWTWGPGVTVVEQVPVDAWRAP